MHTCNGVEEVRNVVTAFYDIFYCSFRVLCFMALSRGSFTCKGAEEVRNVVTALCEERRDGTLREMPAEAGEEVGDDAYRCRPVEKKLAGGLHQLVHLVGVIHGSFKGLVLHAYQKV